METSGEENLFSLNEPQSPLPIFFKKIFLGNYRPNLIITCSPSIFHQETTLQFLRFGEKMKNIKNKDKINEEVSYNKLKKQLENAQAENKRLENLMNKTNNDDNNIINNNKDLSFEELFKSIIDCIIMKIKKF